MTFSGRAGLPFTFRLTWPRCSTGWRSGRSSTARSVRWGPRIWRFRRTLGIPGALGSAGGKSPLLFFYASRSSMNRQFSSIFHCYTLNFRRLSMIDPTGEGFFTVKSDDVVAAFAAGDCRCVQKYQLGFLLIQFVHCLSFVNVCNHFAFVQPYIIWLHVWTYGHVDTLLFISYGLQSKFW